MEQNQWKRPEPLMRQPLICPPPSRFSRSLQQLTSKQKYPDWADVKLEVDGGMNGPVIFKIVRREEGDDPEEGITGDDNMGDGPDGSVAHQERKGENDAPPQLLIE
jgi:hypothetical protein